MNAPFFISTGLSVLCVLLSFLSFGKSQTNNGLQADLLKKQTEIQDLTQYVALQNQDFNRQTEIINTGASVAQKLGPPILRDMGYFAAKNKNEKIRALLVKQKLESFIPNPDQLKEMDKQLDEVRAKQGQPAKDSAPAPKPPATPAAPASETSPAPATPSPTAPTLRPGTR
jgi:hypothetical protein